MSWCEALTYCENLTLGDHDDWRLPNRREFQSILDYSRSLPPIDPAVFGASSEGYWSSTSFAFSPTHAWIVCFKAGAILDIPKGFFVHVRAVRNAP